MGIVFKNNAKTTLASSLSNSATSATVTDGSVFPSLSAGEFFLVTFDDGSNNEICKCTARSGNTLTIVRAQESTTARAFSSGDSAEGRVTAGVLETIQENIAAKSANQTVFNATTAGGATTYNIGTNPGVEANAMVFLNGVLQHHDTLSFSGTNLTFDAAPPNGMALEVIIDNLINLQSSNLTVDTFTAADVVGVGPQTDFVLSDTPAAETNLIVFVDGVFQDQDSYTISSNTLTITDGVIAGRGVTVYVINPVNIGTPSDSTVTSSKLSGDITMPGGLIVGSNDVAFDSPTFVVDNANSRVGLGTASPSVPVDIVGDVKMSASLTVDTDTLVVDSSNNRVGIGIASPSSPNSIDKFLHIHDADHSSLVLSDDQNTWEIVSNNTFTIRDGTDTRLNIDPSGNISIGTTNSASLFHIESASTTAMTIQAGTNSSASLRLKNDAVDWDVNCQTNDNFAIYSQTASAERLVINGSGNIAIGASTPSSGAGWNRFVKIAGGTSNSVVLDGTDSQEADVGAVDGLYISVAGHTTGSNNKIIFRTQSANSNYNSVERMRITSDGHVNIPYQPGARLGLPANQTVTSSAWVDLNFSDTNSSYLMYNKGLTLSSNTITVPTAGRYFICAQFRSEADPFSDASQFGVYFDNSGSGSGSFTQIIRLYIDENYAAQYTHAPPLQGIFDLVAGARIQIRAIAGSSSFTLSSTSNTVNHLSIIKMA